MRRLALVLFILIAGLLQACAGMFGADAETPAQKFYGLKATYQALLTAQVRYRDDCEAKAAELRFGCEEHVIAMQKIDRESVFPAIQRAEAALMAGVADELVAANVVLSAAITELRRYLIDNRISTGQVAQAPPAFAEAKLRLRAGRPAFAVWQPATT